MMFKPLDRINYSEYSTEPSMELPEHIQMRRKMIQAQRRHDLIIGGVSLVIALTIALVIAALVVGLHGV